MKQVGDVMYAEAHKQRRNEGLVQYAKYEHLKAALAKLDNTELYGKRIRLIKLDERGRRRPRSGSRSGSPDYTKGGVRSLRSRSPSEERTR